MSKINLILLVGFILGIHAAFPQKATVSGYIKDASNGESLIGANVTIDGTHQGTVSNAYGFYSLTMTEGNHTLLFSYVGYESTKKEIILQEDMTLTIELEASSQEIEEIVVSAESKTNNVTSTKMSNVNLSGKTIDQVPVLMGEPDVMKTLKLLPGVQATGEASSGVSVRGGNRDQNLILLDEANVYNVSHMGGLFSVFNNDAIKSVEIYKGNMPAMYGGRLSSIIDIRMNEGNTKEFAGTVSLGSISSKATVEAPIDKGKGSFMISGRRTYIDLFTKALSYITNEIEEVPYFFYDLNLKGNYAINDKHRLFLSGYFGRDKFQIDGGDMTNQNFNWGNYTGTVRWNYLINNKLFSNLTFISSNYDYSIAQETQLGNEGSKFEFNWDATMKDYTVKADFGYFLNPKNTIKFGVISTYHDFNVGEVEGVADTSEFSNQIPKVYSLEHAAYIQNEQKITPSLTINYGLRYSLFQNIGKATVYQIDNNYEVTDTSNYDWGDIYNTYPMGFEPRVALTYVLNPKSSIKAAYARTRQYLQVASNSTSETPLDVWVPASEQVKPQISDQYSIGYFRNFLNNNIETSFELYYKSMQNQVDFKDFAEPVLNPQIETEFRFGEGRAYGAELFIQKKSGRINGWISYTLSRSERKIDSVNNNNWYPSTYDVPHNLSIVVNYNILDRLTVSANWVYSTGKPFTAPISRWEYGGLPLPNYPGRNNDRLPDYHRLDIGITLKSMEVPYRKWSSELSLSVYNAYWRDNFSSLSFVPGEENGSITEAYRTSLFPFMIPSISYKVNF